MIIIKNRVSKRTTVLHKLCQYVFFSFTNKIHHFFIYETREYILACKVINENRTIEKVHYDKLQKGTVKEKLKVAKLFEENFKTLEDIKKST